MLRLRTSDPILTWLLPYSGASDLLDGKIGSSVLLTFLKSSLSVRVASSRSEENSVAVNRHRT